MLEAGILVCMLEAGIPVAGIYVDPGLSYTSQREEQAIYII
jgi:hypothetical protein